ncbi:LPS-assembly protein LptD [Pseudochelatococcus contaminans]|uniref:LPS-assembly protein LptD n=1 Tax=Pseudochelatococcus contaminans TaxID=1538103 RepID=A0A7W5Z6Z0_9HYPH|nr:LPS-assembly protein LptD [Pseudochelatococcus contaminans]MBB3810827.1 LPS-assembly protein [Pseudochelatococcus contaminans]
MSLGSVARIAIVSLLGATLLPTAAVHAQQTLNERLAAASGPGEGDSLVVDANEIVYDNDRNTVSAVGNVSLYYQGRSLQADRVTYDRNTSRVLAEGNARLRETDGTVASGDRFELTDDFRDGFIDSLYVETSDRTRFSAPRAERSAGETTTFSKGTYTACEPCKRNPERPPLWQVKAARIIHDNSEQMIYYEDATIEFFGVPLAYIPYFSTPDPTVRRKTGLLTPRYTYSSATGFGISTPFFWAPAPDYDLTLTPTFLTKQGVLGQAEWRQRFMSGSYNIRAAGIFQQDEDVFLESPYGPRGRDFRGSIESSGRFDINKFWHWGWDVALVSDKWFFDNYNVRSESLTNTFFKESTSTAYLLGRSDNAFFDLRGYYFKTLAYDDWQKQQPVVAPTLDYNRRFKGPGRLGGEFEFDLNVTNLFREAAQYRAIPGYTATTFPTGMPYETCAVFEYDRCLVSGIGGRYTRVSTSLSWKRDFIDPLGQVWQPFVGMRVDGFARALNATRFQNNEITNFLNVSSNDTITSRVTPTIGVEYRYPFVASTEKWGTHTIEPIAQIVARPNETRIGELPNEDSQSVVFDSTNLFSWNKFGGYDRAEGGVRANVGLKYTVQTDGGAYGQALFGQSFQIGGRNSYRQYDISHAGQDSGLENTRSDYVAGLYVAPREGMSFLGHARFDESNFALQRFDAQANASFGRLNAGLVFARYAAQPDLGYPYRRTGLGPNASLKLTDNFSLKGSVLFDLDRGVEERYKYQAGLINTYTKSNTWTAANMSLGMTYQDECVVLDVVYTSSLKDRSSGTKRSDSTIMVRLELRTLGEVSFSQDVSGSSSDDGTTQ